MPDPTPRHDALHARLRRCQGHGEGIARALEHVQTALDVGRQHPERSVTAIDFILRFWEYQLGRMLADLTTLAGEEPPAG
jgi:hypothetical protein